MRIRRMRRIPGRHGLQFESCDHVTVAAPNTALTQNLISAQLLDVTPKPPLSGPVFERGGEGLGRRQNVKRGARSLLSSRHVVTAGDHLAHCVDDASLLGG